MSRDRSSGGEGKETFQLKRSPDLTRTEAYDYELPEGRIARYPTERRDESRLLVVPREGKGGGAFRHLRFSRLPELLAPGDLLVLNETARPRRSSCGR